ncbi:cell division protein ZapA [Saccharospirillum mangrovi]|uniref:cell division protein ZapA n=1 Tax=Saccharospirillum mangrovi TaxID=2161747 RepID=UPI000D3ADB8E|nr:cell division protein ZapA [Saccharospirillum mangrovi]
MSQQNTLTVTILEREYRVACPPGQEVKLEQAAASLDRKMKEIRTTGKVFGIERIAVMAALNLTRELLDRQPGDNSEDQAMAERLLRRLDEVLPAETSSMSLDLGTDDSR